MDKATGYKLFELFKTLEDYKKRLSSRIKRDYELPPVTEGLITGGNAIAAIAMAAGKTPEIYSVPREATPYLAETRRSEIGIRPKNISNQEDKQQSQEKKDNPYAKYGQLYASCNALLEKVSHKTKEIYRDAFQKIFTKLRSIYQGSNTGTPKRGYNPFRKSVLTERVSRLSSYPLVNKIFDPLTVKPEYRTTKDSYKAKDIGGLEEILQAA